MNIISLKRKLRELKQLERKIRFGNCQTNPSLIWNLFFAMQETGASKAKYTLQALTNMSHDEYKRVIGEYWSYVYKTLLEENDFHGNPVFDSGILMQWGLPYDADTVSVKKRFRELAKLYHPDTGGDADKFIELMEEYKKLTGK